jgi:hypothetical protein
MCTTYSEKVVMETGPDADRDERVHGRYNIVNHLQVGESKTEPHSRILVRHCPGTEAARMVMAAAALGILYK